MTADSIAWSRSPATGVRKSSVWMIGQRNIAAQRQGRFVPEPGQHPGRMALDLAAEAIRTYSRPGDLVVDPMSGIGTTLVEAVHSGRHTVGVEYEPHWSEIARANLALAARQGAAGHGTVLTTDARRVDGPKSKHGEAQRRSS